LAKLNYLFLKRSYFFVTFAFLVLLNYSEAKQPEQDPTYISKFKTRLNFRLQVNQNNFRQAINPLSSLVYTKSELNNAQLNYGSYLPFSSGFSFNFMFGIYVLSTMVYILSILISCNYHKYKEIMYEPWVNFFKGLFGIVSQPFKLIWQLLLKLFNVYENLCPAINWENKSDKK